MIGQRIYPNEDGQLLFTEPGQYGLYEGRWLTSVPIRSKTNDLIVGNLSKHDVIEYEDGTITVSPSILVTYYDGTEWHGYLERGIWRQV